MKCDEIQDLLVEYLLDELSENESSAISNHLRRGCAECLSLEQEILEGMDGLLAAIPEEPISAADRSRILASATSDTPTIRTWPGSYSNSNVRTNSQSVIEGGHPAETTSWTGVLPYLLAFAAGILLMTFVVPSRVDKLMSGKKPEAQSLSASDSFAVHPGTIPSDSELSSEKHSKTLLVSMERSNKSSQVEGHIVWDTLNHEVHFFGSGITTPPTGMQYVLWLTDQNHQPLAIKELYPDAKGRCKATVASAIVNLRYIFITLESNIAGGALPSKDVQLSLDFVKFESPKL
jgi:hypothetical protein